MHPPLGIQNVKSFYHFLPHVHRWGRGQETFGEDPYHMARLVVEYITGAQDNAPGAVAGPDGKHLLIGGCVMSWPACCDTLP